MKIPKKYDLFMLALVVFIQIGSAVLLVATMTGCAGKNDPLVIDSLVYDQRPAMKGILITKPPVQVVYFGSITDDTIKFTDHILDRIKTIPYHNYNFTNSYDLRIKTASKLHEYHQDEVTNTFSSKRR